MRALNAELFPICRSITGDCPRRTMGINGGAFRWRGPDTPSRSCWPTESSTQICGTRNRCAATAPRSPWPRSFEQHNGA
jgi:hypothetical protein